MDEGDKTDRQRISQNAIGCLSVDKTIEEIGKRVVSYWKVEERGCSRVNRATSRGGRPRNHT